MISIRKRNSSVWARSSWTQKRTTQASLLRYTLQCPVFIQSCDVLCDACQVLDRKKALGEWFKIKNIRTKKNKMVSKKRCIVCPELNQFIKQTKTKQWFQVVERGFKYLCCYKVLKSTEPSPPVPAPTADAKSKNNVPAPPAVGAASENNVPAPAPPASSASKNNVPAPPAVGAASKNNVPAPAPAATSKKNVPAPAPPAASASKKNVPAPAPPAASASQTNDISTSARRVLGCIKQTRAFIKYWVEHLPDVSDYPDIKPGELQFWKKHNKKDTRKPHWIFPGIYVCFAAYMFLLQHTCR